MANWVCTVNIKKYLTNADDAETAKRVAAGIAAELDRAFQEATNPIAVLACMGLPKFAKRLRRVRSVDGINRILSDLYDYGDYHRVWFGL